MRLVRPPASFEGPISTFVAQYVVPAFPAVESLLVWVDALLTYYSRPDAIHIVRGRRRGQLRQELGTRVVDSDNAPGIWCYLRARDRSFPPGRLGAAIDGGELPVLLALSAKERSLWTYGLAMGHADQQTIWGQYLKHCHLLAANPRGVPLTLTQRALRNLCPANHFLFPMPKKYKMERIGWSELPAPADLGESDRIIRWVSYRLRLHLGTSGHDLYTQFARAAGGTPLPTEPPCDGIIRLALKREHVTKDAVERGAHELAELLGGTALSQTEAPSTALSIPFTAAPPPPSTSTSAVNATDREALWRAIFVPAKPLAAAVLLARHPNAAQYTCQLVNGMSAARVVAITNALYNPCRPGRLPSTGRDPSEEAWRVLLARKDQPYNRLGTQWARLMSALEPIPDWAVLRLCEMDIIQLGATAQALVRGPYRAM